MPASSVEDLKRRLSAYPTDAHMFFKQGFSAAARLSDEVRGKVVDELVANFRRGKRRVDGSTLRSMTGLSSLDSERLMSAYSLLIGLLSEAEVSLDDLVEAGRDVIYFPEDGASMLAILKPINEGLGEIDAAVQRAQLAGRVLPSFQRMEVVIDLRLQFADGKVKHHIPVAVAYLKTDVATEDMWFQMSRGDVEDTIKSLNEVLSNMIAAETIYSAKSD